MQYSPTSNIHSPSHSPFHAPIFHHRPPMGIPFHHAPVYTPSPPPPMPTLDDPKEPELLILCHQKKMAYAPGNLMRTYDAAIDYAKRVFPALADARRDGLSLYVDTQSELVRVPADAWSAVFPTLGAPTFGLSTARYVFIEADWLPSALPSWPFQASVQDWFAAPPPVFTVYPPGWNAGHMPHPPSSNASTESLTVMPPAPPPPFTASTAAPAPVEKARDEEKEKPKQAPRRSFWGSVTRFLGAGREAATEKGRK